MNDLFPTLMALAFPIGIVVLVYAIRAKRKKKHYERLTPDQKRQYDQKKSQDVANTMTVLFPMAIFVALKSEMGVLLALVTSLCIAVVMKFLFSRK